MANIERVNAELKKELFTLINFELNDPRIESTVTISKVDTSKDLKHCKVYIVKSAESDNSTLMQVLQSSASFLRKQLFSKLRIRTVPELKFVLDDSLEHAVRINEILSKLEINKDER